ncbi:MAG: heme A synthase [Candidatus Hydrogenedentota bacterium]
MNSSTDPGLKRFRTAARITLAAIYFLILFGASVRATGSGMGCPDWPKCFGRWIPPTDASQLPPNYEELYPYYAGLEFNAFHTWTEYFNRLTGAVVGLLTIVTLGVALTVWRRDRGLAGLALAAVLLTGLAGWLGKEVVGSHLTPWMITVHMAVAVAIVAVLAWAVARSQRDQFSDVSVDLPSWFTPLLFGTLALSLVQVFLGTRVRESVDVIAVQLGEELRSQWFARFGLDFMIHRSLSILVLLTNGVAFLLVRRFAPDAKALKTMATILIAIIAAEIATGASLYYLGMPAILQPVHLLLAAMLFGTQFSLWVMAGYHRPRVGTRSNAADAPRSAAL